MPDIENSRKTAEKGAEWVTVKQPKNSQKNSRNTPEKQLFGLFFGCVSAVLPAVFRLRCRDPLGTLFLAVFRLFSMSETFGTSVDGRIEIAIQKPFSPRD